ncbi:MAG: DsbA family protein [Actinomycetota bacterium]|nr:DsbA family protein [Actinomycetota bacterium]
MEVSCYYDYTCVYSYRAWQWMRSVASAIPGLEVTWKTFSLKELNRENEASLFDDVEIGSTSILALSLAHAARSADFDAYHERVFSAMHADARRVDALELLATAKDAGVDVEAFDRERGRWVAEVAAEHAFARSRWEVFGTPTFVLADESAVYLKLAQVPQASQAEELWRALWTISVTHPELVEIKRPH